MKARRLVPFDWALKKMLRSKANFAILEGFLSELLHQDIRIIEILESESNQQRAFEKYTRVDLKVRNQHDELLIIEVQYEREFDYLQRILYGVSKTISEHLNAGEAYAHISKVISINILYFDLGHGEDYVYHGTTHFHGIHEHDELQLNDKQRELYGKERIFELYPEYYLLKINQLNDIAKDKLDEWIYFLKNEAIEDSFSAKGLKEAKETLDVMKLPEPERQAFESHMEDLHYQASMVESSYGVGMMKGIQKGIEQGIEQGIEKGIEQGAQKERLNIARSLLDVLDNETIALKTGLHVDDIQNLRQV